MKIKIDNTLHGYQNGHQLLMASAELSNEAKMTLLVQSDLSGSNIDEEFKSYITGYPLISHYAFSRTWYADEMRRPGCVWTHTLLISFADLGKIPDLSVLQSFFKRPIKDNYNDYSVPIFVEREDLLNSVDSYKYLNSALLQVLYTEFDKSIICPAVSPLEFEDAVLELWSYQWPRLRRNFLFCTGALSLKTLNSREFDLQIVPRRNLNLIEKQAKTAFVVFKENPINEEWVNILFQSNKNNLRKFLWFYGSDVNGMRKNYVPLLKLYAFSNLPELKFDEVYSLMESSFGENEALLLKEEMLGEKQLFKFDQKQLLEYLLFSEVRNKVDSNYIHKRLLETYYSNKITLSDLAGYYLNSSSNLVDLSFWNEINLSIPDIIALFNFDKRFITLFKNRIIEASVLEDTWSLNYKTQVEILSTMESIEGINWEAVIYAILKSNSGIIAHVFERDSYSRIYNLLTVINNNNYNITNNLIIPISRNKRAVQDFIKKNASKLNSEICEFIFQYLIYSEIERLDMEGLNWISIFKKIKKENVKITASGYLCALGLNRKVKNPAIVVSETFGNLYRFAQKSKISLTVWNLIPIDLSEQEDDYDPIYSFLNYFNLIPKRKNQLRKSDYCGLLIPTLVNKFMKNQWSHQLFVNSLASEEITHRAAIYCLGFRKGSKFLKTIVNEIEHKKITVEKHHFETLKLLRGYL